MAVVVAPRPDATGPGTGDLAGLVGYRLRRAQLRISADLADSLGPLELRPVTFSVLALIGASPGLSQTAVGDLLGIQRANFVPVASELERMGLIERSPAPLDRRQYVLHLTADGRRLLKRAWKLVRNQEARIERTLGPAGMRQLLALLEALSSAGAQAPGAANGGARNRSARSTSARSSS